MKRKRFLPFLFLLAFPVWAQHTAIVNTDERLSFVGMTLAEVIERFGAPRTVFTARGNELWQDDVVFQYPEGDFHFYRDRVWQVRLTSVSGISNRDRKAAVLLILGNTAEDRGDHVLFSISGRDWPLMLRVNFNNSGLVSAIYVYRPDF
jgi:hypothetical protein